MVTADATWVDDDERIYATELDSSPSSNSFPNSTTSKQFPTPTRPGATLTVKRANKQKVKEAAIKLIKQNTDMKELLKDQNLDRKKLYEKMNNILKINFDFKEGEGFKAPFLEEIIVGVSPEPLKPEDGDGSRDPTGEGILKYYDLPQANLLPEAIPQQVE